MFFVSLDLDAPKFAINNPNLFTDIPDLNLDFEVPEVTTKSVTKTTNPEITNIDVPKWLITPYTNSSKSNTTSANFTAQGPTITGNFGNDISPSLKTSIEKWLGIPYQFGGNGPENNQGLDCSGFVSRVLSSMGYSLHGDCRDLWSGTSRLDKQDLKPGDLVFLQGTQPGRIAQGKASHVAIVTDVSKLGDGKISVAQSGGTGKKSNVVEWDLNKGYYSKHFLGAGRVVQNAKFGGKIDYTKAHE